MLDLVDDSVARRVTDVVNQIAQAHNLREPIGTNVPLVDAGFTSMAMVDLMLAVEAEFDVTIPQADMTPETFRSIESLACLVRRL